MRSSWGSRFVLPAAQVVAEGSWLAVLYAAFQALAGEHAWVGPLELAAAAAAGMAWGRRRRWHGESVEALGLPLLALAAGALGWLIDPQVRQALLEGQPLAAAASHGAGWLAAVAFWRGEMHRSREDDDALQEQLLRWAVPGLALPWLVGHLAAEGAIEREFMAAAFVGTVFFAAAALVAVGLARLEALEATSGRLDRSWIALSLGVVVGVTLAAIPAAALLEVPVRNLMVAALSPLQLGFVILLLLATPVVVVAAAVAEALGPFLPEGFGLGQIQLPRFDADARQAVSLAPVLIFYAIVVVILVLELAVVVAILWMRRQERRRMRLAMVDPFEERSIVVPDAAQPPSARQRAPGRRGTAPSDAYLEALAALARDGRWSRDPGETPAAHLDRLRHGHAEPPGLARLAAAYQLVRYGGRVLPAVESRRMRRRVAGLRRHLRRA